MYKRYRIILMLTLIFTISLIYTSSVYAQTYGLKFKGYDLSLDKRTELNLTPDGFLRFQDEFEISFDYKATRIRQNSDVGLFGYVFRIIDKEDNNVDLLTAATPGLGLNLVLGKSHDVISATYPEEAINNWIHLRIKFLLAEDRLIFYTPDTFYVKENVGFNKQGSFKIIFGANDYKRFKNSDVPSMSIKDIEIHEKGKLKYQWLLNEKEGNIATDNLKGRKAKVINPSWMTLIHQNWRNTFNDEIAGYVTVTSDEESDAIFLVGENDLIIYSSQKNTARKIKYKNAPLFFNKNYRAIYNPSEKNIYCYVVDEEPYYSLDVTTGEWNDVGTSADFQTKFRHHNHFYNKTDNSIYLLGGYGFHRYNNELLKIDLSNGMRTELPVDASVFTPRYLAGSAALNDTIYLLGGYGNESGDQILSPQSYFDLIAYSLKDSSFVKKFEIPRLIDDMVVGNSMWIDKKNRTYYALIFSKIKSDGDLQLIKGSLDSPDVELVGDKIPFNFHDVRSVANLFYMSMQNKLYAYTSYETDSTTQVAIFSINNPPNRASAEFIKLQNKSWWYLYVALAILMMTGLGLWLFGRKRKTKIRSNGLTAKSDLELQVNESEIVPEPILEQANYNLILFGGFQVFSKDFIDITNKFSPLLKELFLLILLHTYKNNKGISSDKITEILWYDKSEKSARNNRAVNIAKLRSILEEVGPCELSKKTGYWKINFKDSIIKSDYSDLLNITVSKNNLSKLKVNQLIEITQKGAFLSNVHYEWLDAFKASVSDAIVDTLVVFGQSCDVKKEADFIIHLADSLFNFDVINEDAMILKCKAQYCLGKHSQAKATYQKFFKEYMTMYDQEYNRSFLDILEIKE